VKATRLIDLHSKSIEYCEASGTIGERISGLTVLWNRPLAQLLRTD